MTVLSPVGRLETSHITTHGCAETLAFRRSCKTGFAGTLLPTSVQKEVASDLYLTQVPGPGWHLAMSESYPPRIYIARLGTQLPRG